MSFADTFGAGGSNDAPYQQLSGAPPIQMSTVKKELRANLRSIIDTTAEIAKRAKALSAGSGARGESASESRAAVFGLINSVRETARASMAMLRHASHIAPPLHQPELSGLQDELRTALARFHTVAENASHMLGPAPQQRSTANGLYGGGLQEVDGETELQAQADVAIRIHGDDASAPLMASDIRTPEQLQTQTQLQQTKESQQLAATISLRSETIAERQAGIEAVQQSVRDVQEIFQDLALLVHEQGTQIDNIQTNIENASQRVHRGVAQLQTAAKSQVRYRRNLCTCVLLGLVAIIVFVCVLKFALKAAMPF